MLVPAVVCWWQSWYMYVPETEKEWLAGALRPPSTGSCAHRHWQSSSAYAILSRDCRCLARSSLKDSRTNLQRANVRPNTNTQFRGVREIVWIVVLVEYDACSATRDRIRKCRKLLVMVCVTLTGGCTGNSQNTYGRNTSDPRGYVNIWRFSWNQNDMRADTLASKINTVSWNARPILTIVKEGLTSGQISHKVIK